MLESRGDILSAVHLTPGTDHQAFCYDERNRLVWAGTSGTPPCGGSLTSGTLSSAAYTQSFAYDDLNRMTSGPSGALTYGDSTHRDAVTAISSTWGYSASYDAAGNMTCRLIGGGTGTCSVRQNVAQGLTYDNEGWLSKWVDNVEHPNVTQTMAYDGEGQRVALSVNGVTTYSLGSLEEVGSSGTVGAQYLVGGNGLPVTVRMPGNGTPLAYVVTDGLGSVAEALDGSGDVTFQQLFTPYGAARYSQGGSPTSDAFTGQRSDKQTGLDYFNARYYDPSTQTFISADTASDGLNRYAYVHDNPETLTDPSGHRAAGCVQEDGAWYCPTPPPPPATGCRATGDCLPPPPPPPSCQATSGCDGSDGGSPVLATTDDIQTCFSVGYPAWCAKYLTYESMCQTANGRPMPCQLTSYWDPIKIKRQVDFIVLQFSLSPDFLGIGSVEFTYIYLTPTHSLSDVDWRDPQWRSYGAALSWGFPQLGNTSALLGFGVLLTEGAKSATEEQVELFLSGGSLSLGGSFMFYGITRSTNANGVAIISTISTSIINLGGGGGFGVPTY